ncbi:MAG: bifunctional UDP-N-acetylglucosamine diphosphorylase/glucosamine-1-phosphate N-acetyltransferase GlmU [Deltaproteobacteria bacterium]|nr:bifunctional UDP-N-acetylglucosamine diphosphorylase/glucosamine-1-phosphate N-acetyltransferase GlmU [Deltaproteobacteria bacterium]
MKSLAAIVLAAGKSTRMKSKKSKLLHEVGGQSVISRVCMSLSKCSLSEIIVVCSHQMEPVMSEVRNVFSSAVKIDQGEAKGTGHAVLKGLEGLKGKNADVMVIAGDIPLITHETLNELHKVHIQSGSKASFITMMCENPFGYGRVIRHDNRVIRITEESELAEDEKDLKECNSGIYIFSGEFLNAQINTLNSGNSKNEFYLTDLIEKASEFSDVATISADESEVTGVNTRAHLAGAEKFLNDKVVSVLMDMGVGFVAPSEVVIHDSVVIGMDTFIHKDVVLTGKTFIGEDVVIEQGCIITDSVIERGAQIKPYSVIEESYIGENSVIGPFARLRPGNKIGEKCKIGNFVEMKKTCFGAGVKAGHLTYLGDADVGDHTNIGAGTITCNYDGKNKFKTVIGHNVFVGSDSQFIAPVEIGDDVYIGTGTTVIKDVDEGSLVINPKKQKVITPWTPPGKRGA